MSAYTGEIKPDVLKSRSRGALGNACRADPRRRRQRSDRFSQEGAEDAEDRRSGLQVRLILQETAMAMKPGFASV